MQAVEPPRWLIWAAQAPGPQTESGRPPWGPVAPPAPFCICSYSLLWFDSVQKEDSLPSPRAPCRGGRGSQSSGTDYEDAAPDHGHFETDTEQPRVRLRPAAAPCPSPGLALTWLRCGWTGFRRGHPDFPSWHSQWPLLTTGTGLWHPILPLADKDLASPHLPPRHPRSRACPPGSLCSTVGPLCAVRAGCPLPGLLPLSLFVSLVRFSPS